VCSDPNDGVWQCDRSGDSDLNTVSIFIDGGPIVRQWQSEKHMHTVREQRWTYPASALVKENTVRWGSSRSGPDNELRTVRRAWHVGDRTADRVSKSRSPPGYPQRLVCSRLSTIFRSSRGITDLQWVDMVYLG
jgi:hypothetical protein